MNTPMADQVSRPVLRPNSTKSSGSIMCDLERDMTARISSAKPRVPTAGIKSMGQFNLWSAMASAKS